MAFTYSNTDRESLLKQAIGVSFAKQNLFGLDVPAGAGFGIGRGLPFPISEAFPASNLIGPGFSNVSLLKPKQPKAGAKELLDYPERDLGRNTDEFVYQEFELDTEKLRALGVDWLGNKIIHPVYLDQYLLWLEPVVSLQARDTVVESTPVNSEGRDFVLEITQKGAIRFQVEGLLLRPDGAQPVDEIKRLMELRDKKGSIGFSCAVADAVGVGQVVIEEVTIRPVRTLYANAMRGVWEYTFSLIEDKTAEYTLLNR